MEENIQRCNMAGFIRGRSFGRYILHTAVNMPDYDPQQLSGAKTTFIYDDKQQVVFRLHAEENRTEITLDKVPRI